MRDSDVSFTTVFIARADSPIHSLSDLKGKRFALGSRDSSHAAILPVHFLREAGLDSEKVLDVGRFDTDIGKHGDTGTSEQNVVRAVTEEVSLKSDSVRQSSHVQSSSSSNSSTSR
jgi:ABC-type phosphate/phosphonate transport system substrate-binding protein